MEYQLTIATLENRPVRYELWIYGDVIVDNGVLQIGTKKLQRKVPVNSDSSLEISRHMSIEDWTAGKGIVIGVRDFQPGDIEEIFNKEYTEELGEQIINTGKIMLFLSPTKNIMFTPDEYTGTVPNITVTREIVEKINYDLAGEFLITKISDGKLIL